MVTSIIFNNRTDPVVSIDTTHLFSWKFKGINCATDDYSLGTVSSLDFEFETDLEVKYIKDQTTILVYINNQSNAEYCGYVTSIERVKNTKNHFHVYATDVEESLDTPIGESDLTPVENETLAQLAGRLHIPYDTTIGVNGSYVVNPNWGYTGVTKRDVARWIYQLQGLNYGGAADKEAGSINTINWFAPTTIGTGDAVMLVPSEVKSIDKADYMTQQIDRIWFGNDESDTGLSYGNGTQSLLMPINPLINYNDTSFLQPIYNKVNALISYTPMKISTYLDGYKLISLIHNQQRFWWMSYTEDGVTYSCPIFNWEASPEGITLEGKGSPDRTTTNAYLGGEISNAGKFNKFNRTLDETRSEVGTLSGQVSTISQTAASLTIEVANKVGYDEVISSINQTAETISINANKINLNGAVTANNNVTIGVDGVISAVGATLTDVHINGGNINIQSGNLNNNAIILKDSSGTYQAAFRPSGFETKYNNLTTTSMDSYGGINSYYREIPGVVDTSSYQFGCWGGTKYKGRSYLRFDGLGIQGGPNGPTDFNRNGSRGYFNIDVGTGMGSSYTPTYNTNIIIEKWGNGSISKDVCLDVDGLKFNDSNGNVVAEYNRNGASVIGRGTTSGWQWRRWSNGWTECWTAKHYQNINITSGWGSVYYGEIPQLAYPVTFKTNTFYPREIVSAEGGDTSASSHISVFLANASPGTRAGYSGKYLVMRPTSASDADFWVDYYVFGIEDR